MSDSTISSAFAERRTEGVQQMRRSRVAMRLKRDHEPPIERRPRGGHDGRDLCRVVAVVVDHEHAVDFAVALETTFGAVKAARAP